MQNSRSNLRDRRILAYRRVATLTQGPVGSSLEEQLLTIRRYCKANGLPRPSEIHAEMGPGNGKGAAIADLINGLETGDTVVITSVDRLARDPVAVVTIVRAIQQKGAALVSVTDDFDSRRPESETILSLLENGWRGLIRNARR